ncbi:MAG: hypothetical protein V2G33_05450 [bacterium JZ-2024 1]
MGWKETIKQWWEKGKKESRKAIEKTDIFFQIKQLQSERREKMLLLGERLFPHLQKMNKEEKIRAISEDLIQKIEDLDQEIALLKARMEEISQRK